MNSQGFTRWYDTDPRLSQAVRMLERAPIHYQRTVARAMLQTTELSRITADSGNGIKKAGSQKIIGLMKSKAKRRWYDRDPDVHRAFNYLFMMSQPERAEIAVKIIITLKAMDAYEGKNRTMRPDVNALLLLAKGIFARQASQLLTQAHIVPLAEDPAAGGKIETASFEEEAPPQKKPATKPLPERTIQADASGMRVIKLKMES